MFFICVDDRYRAQHRAIIKSTMQKAQVYKGYTYAFGGIITKMCPLAGVLEERLDYMARLYPVAVDINRTKGSHTNLGPTLITVEPHKTDELITARMYGLEMLWHRIGGRSSNVEELGKVNSFYPLNAHAEALLGIGLELVDR